MELIERDQEGIEIIDLDGPKFKDDDVEVIDIDDVNIVNPTSDEEDIKFYQDPSTNDDDYENGFADYLDALVPKGYTAEQMNSDALNFRESEDVNTRQRLIVSNIKRVKSKSKEFADYYNVDQKELASQGYFRLVTLVEEFKKSEEPDFDETIEKGINRCMEAGVATQKGVPPEYISIIWKTKKILQRENGTTPTIEEVLEYIGNERTISQEVKEDIARQFHFTNSTSIDALRDNGGDIVSNDATPQSRIEENIDIKGINEGINNLPRMGINGAPGFMETIQNAAPAFEPYKDYEPKSEKPFTTAHEIVQTAMEQSGFHYNPETDDPSIEIIDIEPKQMVR